MTHAGAQGGGDVQFRHAAPGGDPCVGCGGGDSGDGLDLGGAHGGRAGLDLIDAGGLQGASDLGFFVDGEGDAWGLLAVAQGGVVDKETRLGVGHG